EYCDDVDGVAPGVRLLHAVGRRVLGRQAREHDLGEPAIPADDVERLEGLVREVENVADADVAVIRGRGEEHVRELPVVGARRNGSTGSAPPSTSPITDFAITSGRLRSSPSSRRSRRWASGSPSGARSTQTSPSRTSTGKTRRSSAHWSNVPPVATSKRAWCQW